MAPPPSPQGVVVPNSKEPGYSSIYRNVNYPNELQPYERSEVTTLFESFERSVKEGPKRECLGHREYNKATKTWGPYVWETYEDIYHRRNRFGSGVLTLFEQVAKVESLLWINDSLLVLLSRKSLVV
jgi:long-chain acyl-CoA synthetase